MSINIAIVEDSPNDAQILSGYLSEYFKNTDKQYTIEIFESSVYFLDKYTPRFDIVFMDIEMPNMNGMETAAKLREVDKEVLLIFVTNMSQFAVRGYDVEAFGYLIKPVTYQSIALKLVKAVARLSQLNSGTIIINSKTKFLKVNTSNIKYVEVRGHSLTWHTIDGVYTSTGSLVHLRKQLGEGFAFCNQCYLVNLRYCEELNGMEIRVGGEVLQVSRYKKAEFLSSLNKYFNGI